MKAKFITAILILIFSFQLKGQKFLLVKGKVANENDGHFIGAIVEEYGNWNNRVYTDINGEFEITISKKNKNILRVTYCCSLHEFLYEVIENEDYLRIEIYTKRARKRTKKIKRQLKKKLRNKT